MSNSCKKPSSRQALLATAEDLFSQNGFFAVSTRSIAKEAGANLASIKYHFGSKAKLFEETFKNLIEREHQRVVKRLNHIREISNHNALIEYWTMLEELLNFTNNDNKASPFRIMYRELLNADIYDNELCQALISIAVKSMYSPFFERLKSLVNCIAPDTNELEVFLLARSIYGECLCYALADPAVTQFREANYRIEPHRTIALRHIFSFTLRGMGVVEQDIQKALTTVTKGMGQ